MEVQNQSRRYILTLSLSALGIVYGDIGTSPLYALKECFHGPHALQLSRPAILGVLSLIFWSLIIVISVKYLAIVMRADNRGEGGILALMSLIKQGERKRRPFWLTAIALFGAALLYGDGMITPAISVLSAVEGLEIATPLFKPYVIPTTVVILIGLFMVQRRGTAGIGAIFGPVTLAWFSVIGALGVWQIAKAPEVLRAVNPMYAAQFFADHRWAGVLALGAVFLVVTGGEALYADMGHFGIKPIRLAWFAVVLPALLLNYFGQGALLLHMPAAAKNPFFYMAPQWALYPLVVLATVATSIASQAVISGAFSLTRQAVQLGYSPRVAIQQTSEREIGQIYIAMINWFLAAATIGLVFGFQTSSRLANAYGVAVTTTMFITTILLYVVARDRWGWSRWVAIPVCAGFLVIDLAFFIANIVKVHHGGWFPLLVAAGIFTLMATWRRGRHILDKRLKESSLPVDVFLQSISHSMPHRVKGTAIFMFRDSSGTPTALLHNLKHNQVLHENVVLLNVVYEEMAHVQAAERTEFEDLGQNVYRIRLHFGFVEDPDIPAALALIEQPSLNLDPQKTTYFLGRETLIATKNPGMAIWREKLFAWMSNNARSAASFFHLPANRVVELGAQIEL